MISFHVHCQSMTSWADFGTLITLNATNVNMFGLYMVPQAPLVCHIATARLTTLPATLSFKHELGNLVFNFRM